MTSLDPRTRPLDPRSIAALAESGLDYVAVPHDGVGFDRFLQAVARGFLDPVPTAEQIDDSREGMRNRRLVGVFDRSAPDPQDPVATIDSWLTQLTTEPGRTVPMWAISGVTVAPTHRRRGIASAMLEGELRAAAAAGLPLAGLTVTEATIYARWGFSPAVYTTDWTIDTTRARWTGPRPTGRLSFVDAAELPDRLGALRERTRLARPGEVEGWAGLYRRAAGLRPGADEARKVRAVAYVDEAGDERGILVYTVAEKPDFSRADLDIRLLDAVDDQARAALWRFALDHDLVGTVNASLQPADAAIRWMISDQRAARVSVTDHEWLRILDVPAALASRHYAAPANLLVRVSDPLGLAEGTWRFEVSGDGSATVTPDATATADVETSVNALSSLLLGGVRADTMRAAGMLTASDDVVGVLDRSFAPAAVPLLGIWY